MARVYIDHLNEQEDYLSIVEEGLRYINFADLIPPNGTVFIKPNLTFPNFEPGVMTNPAAVEAVIKAVQAYTPNILLGDSDSGGYNPFSMDAVYAETGLAAFAEKYGVQVVNLSKQPRKTINFTYQRKDIALDLPRVLTDEIDLMITMPVPKIHMNTGVSLGFKNQWGCIPEPNDRLKMHPYLRHVLVEVNRVCKTNVAIMDGRYGLTRSGPMVGDAVRLDWVMVGDDIGAVSQVALDLMQIPLSQIDHIKYAKSHGMVPDHADITTNQSIEPFKKDAFYLKRALTDYPGLMAFNSAWLAWLAYFSPLADFLHWVLYLFRKPFYDYDEVSR